MNKQENTVTISPADIGAKSMEAFLEAINRHVLVYGVEVTCLDGKCRMAKADGETFLWLKGHGAMSSSDLRLEKIKMQIQIENDLSAAQNHPQGAVSWRGLENFAQENFQPYS